MNYHKQAFYADPHTHTHTRTHILNNTHVHKIYVTPENTNSKFSQSSSTNVSNNEDLLLLKVY